ncbi:UNVERIFIED_ORG: hypothetical protein ABID57_000707 [Arthrobacter sp. UYEF1]
MPRYETKQGILEEAGLSLKVLGETLTGSVDGSNKVFTTAYGYLTDANDDDTIDNTDVTAYVDGVAVNVSDVNEINHTITLQAAPTTGKVVTADYRYSNITDSYVEKIREEAEAWINEAMDGIDSTPYTTVPATVRKLTRQYAAANLLIREYGMNQNTDGTSKDGYNRLKTVEAALAKYIAIGGSTGLSNVSGAEVDVYAEPEIFSTYTSGDGYISQDDVFLRDLGIED